MMLHPVLKPLAADMPPYSWDPAAEWFANGEQGFVLDPSDLSTMFQDVEGTVPVTAPGQAVALILDKSGRGNHFIQPAESSRPKFEQLPSGHRYLAFDGIDDCLLSNSIDFTGTDKVTVLAGVTKLSDAAPGTIVETSADSGSNNGSFLISSPTASTPGVLWRSRGTIGATANVTSGYDAPITMCVTGIGDISAPTARLRINGSEVASSSFGQGTGKYGNHQAFIGARNNASNRFNGRLYGMIARAAEIPDLTPAERWVAIRTPAKVES